MPTKVWADGIGFLNYVDNYPIVSVEGAWPGASECKSFDDNAKNDITMSILYNNIVILEAEAHQYLFSDLRVYGLTSSKTEISLTMMDFCSMYCSEIYTKYSCDFNN